ncbi:MAG: hypothetical protein QNJ53_30640 [Pleurocapsa sp. MO_192.B19]|nr:hypothetical protein [Pleurocapsa sp. MO_192.B19]
MASRLKVFSYFKNINDERGILLPSLLFIASPFISVCIFALLKNGELFEFLRSLALVATVLTFFLGQVYERNRKNIEKGDREKYIAKRALYSLNKLILFGVLLSKTIVINY